MNRYKVCVIGLGNVGFNLAVIFSKKYQTIGFDNDKKLIKKINKKAKLNCATDKKSKLIITNDYKLIIDSNVYIITVPTPVDNKKKPDLGSILDVTRLVSKFIKKGNIIIYESTFYPGLTEEVCIPLIENKSNLKINKDFFVGYSPERINIGENEKMSQDIIKITSGSNHIAGKVIDDLYKSVINAGTYQVKNIKTAEAVKVLENCQRDINIAFMNELSKFFKKINVDTNEVIEAAATKWNFSKFYPGLVGGDCIATDPYYILHAAKKNKCSLPLVRLARETNEFMFEHITDLIAYKLSKIKVVNLAFFGISYKEECDQINNSMYLKIAKKLSKKYSLDIYDHMVENGNIEFNLTKMKIFKNKKYDAIVIGSKHKKYKKISFKNQLNKSGIIIDIHGASKHLENKIL